MTHHHAPSAATRHGADVLRLPLRRAAAPRAESPVSVAVRATDPITEGGTRAWLHTSPRVTVLPEEQEHRAEVSLFLATRVTDTVLGAMRRHHTRVFGADCPAVVVADSMTERQLLAAVDFGLVRFLPRADVGFADVVDALAEAPTAWSHLPEALAGRLMEEFRRCRATDASAAGAGLRPREVQILRMLADGVGTAEIARALSYSERTIKGVIHEVTHRLGLRNRTQAVAYGIRAGVV